MMNDFVSRCSVNVSNINNTYNDRGPWTIFSVYGRFFAISIVQLFKFFLLVRSFSLLLVRIRHLKPATNKQRNAIYYRWKLMEWQIGLFRRSPTAFFANQSNCISIFEIIKE